MEMEDHPLYGKRKKKKDAIANPLFVEWLTEWKEEAAEKGWKSQYTYGKVIYINFSIAVVRQVVVIVGLYLLLTTRSWRRWFVRRKIKLSNPLAQFFAQNCMRQICLKLGEQLCSFYNDSKKALAVY